MSMSKEINAKVKILINERENGESLLDKYTKSNNLNKVKELVGLGADIHSVDSLGKTPLHLAAENGYLSLVKYFIKKEASHDIEDDYGCRPLYLAVRNGHFLVVKYLVSEGADIIISNNDGETLMEVAEKSGNLNIINYLKNPKCGDNANDIIDEIIENLNKLKTLL